MWMLILGVAVSILDIGLGVAGPDQLITPGNAVSVVTLIPSIAIGARRLHDIGRSGWWLLLYFTIIGAFVILYWAVRNGERSENDFGPDVEAGKKLAELP